MEPPLPLSPGEVASFKRDGVLVRRGCIPNAHCAAVRDQLWAAEHHHLRRDQPESWIGGDHQAWPAGSSEAARAETDSPESWDDTRMPFFWGYRAFGNQEPLISLARGTEAWRIASQLLGDGQVIEPRVGAPWWRDRVGDVHQWSPERARGVLWNLPRAPGAVRTDICANPAPGGPHADALPFHVGMTAYMDDVPPGGGGFTVWPTSHVQLYQSNPGFGDVVGACHRFDEFGELTGRFTEELRPAYESVEARIRAGSSPAFEFSGEAGDALFYYFGTVRCSTRVPRTTATHHRVSTEYRNRTATRSVASSNWFAEQFARTVYCSQSARLSSTSLRKRTSSPLLRVRGGRLPSSYVQICGVSGLPVYAKQQQQPIMTMMTMMTMMAMMAHRRRPKAHPDYENAYGTSASDPDRL